MCDRCGLVYQSTPLNASELRSVNQNPDETLRRLQPKRLSHKIRQGQERWAWIMDRLSREDRDSIDTLLEIGSGEGTLLEAARKSLHEAVGIEYNPLFVTFCQEKGLKVIKGEWPQTAPDSRFALVAMLHVVEHLSDPLFSLRRVKDVLREDGVLCIETPDVWRPVGNLQNTFLGPDHLILLSEGTIKPFLAKAGFEVFAVERVELGLRVLARPRPDASFEITSAHPAKLRRRLIFHQIRWQLIAEWREWLAGRRSALGFSERLD